MADGGDDAAAAPSAQEPSSQPRRSSSTHENTNGLAVPVTSRRASILSQSTDATEIASRQSSPASQTGETNVASSENPTLDASALATNGTTASPYGTRSRNRTTASRPNYAEDVEMEFEMTVPPEKTGGTESGPISPVQTTSETSRPVASNKRRASTVANVAPVTNGTHTASKETAPQKTAPAAEATVSRKRKAGASTSISQPTNAPSQPPRKPGYYYVPINTPRNGTNMVTFTVGGAYLVKGKLKADDGTFYSLNDTVYLVCEPPGEPYYMGRIMEFLHLNNDPAQPVEMLRMNWFYRPRDISRKSTDTRYLYATMHSETSPLSSLRGKCNIIHKSEIDDMDEFRKNQDSFWFDRLYDRYIMRFYDVVPTSHCVNVPPKIKKVMDEQWKYLIVEPIRGKELTSAAQSCKRCAGFCANTDSVECAVCHQSYHMNCVRPPLLKKPTRGFAWACAPCNRAQEKRLEARNITLVKDGEDEIMEDEEEEAPPQNGTESSSTKSEAEEEDPVPVATEAQKARAKLWPFRYLGIHCKVEDVLDFDDRIYPRASSRLGPRHQASVLPWYGRPFELVKAIEIKRKYVRGANGRGRENKLTKESQAQLEAAKAIRENRPKWIIDAPPGYIERGQDHPNSDPGCTSYSTFMIPEVGQLQDLPARGEDPELNERAKELQSNIEAREKVIDDYMAKAKLLAPGLNVTPLSTNFLTKAIELLYKHQYDEDAALKELRTMHKKNDLKEPEFKPDEVKRFEEGIAKYGTDLRSVQALVKSQKIRDIIRYYYVWKKTDRGKLIWGNFEGRRNKKESKRTDNAVKVLDDVADDQDDSAFDDEKIADKKRGFQCKFCDTRHSRHWRRAPGVPPGTTISADPAQKPNKDKSNQLMLALCHRCAELWRRYGLQWEDLDEVARKIAAGGGRLWRRRIDEEQIRELNASTDPATGTVNAAGNVSPVPPTVTTPTTVGEPRKRQKLDVPPLTNGTPALAGVSVKKKIEKPPVVVAPPPVVVEPPKPKLLTCATCRKIEPQSKDHVTCKECRLVVHRDCYGVSPSRVNEKWTCDMCANDKNPQVSLHYSCVLCPSQNNGSQKALRKKGDKDKERIDREEEEAQRLRQLESNKPLDPREPLKATAGNNWVHVMCAVWTPEIKFGRAETLEPVEGIGNIPAARYEAVCKFCKIETGACVPCHTCHTSMHVTCAQRAGCIVGFDITPVKSSRRDATSVVKLGEESGVMTALVWCKEHPPKNSFHTADEISESGISSLQLFVRTYKQADLTLTGTVRKASLANLSKTPAHAVGGMRRASTVGRHSAVSPNGADTKLEEPTSGDTIIESVETTSEPASHCVNCGIDASPLWYPASTAVVNGKGPENGDHAYTNGTTRHSSYDSDATEVNGASPQLRPTLDTSMGGRALVICHKCHWRKKNGESTYSYEPSEIAKAIVRPMPSLQADSPPPPASPTPPPPAPVAPVAPIAPVVPVAPLPPPPPPPPPPAVLPQLQTPLPPRRATPPFMSQPPTAVWPVQHPPSVAQTYPRWQQPLGPHNPPPHMNGHPPPPPQPPAPPQMHGLPHQMQPAQPSYSYAGPAALPPRDRQNSIPPNLPPHPLSVSLPARRDYPPPSSYAMSPQQHQSYAHAHPSHHMHHQSHPRPHSHSRTHSHSNSHPHSRSPTLTPGPPGPTQYAHAHQYSHQPQHHHHSHPHPQHSPHLHHHGAPQQHMPHMSSYTPESGYPQRSPYNGEFRGYPPDHRTRSPSREDDRRNGTPNGGSGGASAKASLANLLS